MDNKEKEVCSIRIVFPVESDEQAFDYKKKIGEVFKDESDVQIQFGITTPMARPPMG